MQDKLSERARTPALKPGAVYGCSTVIGPGSPEYIGKHRYVRVECWSCKERRDVAVCNLLAGTCRRCRKCARAARGAKYRLESTGAGGQFYLREFDAL